MNIGTLSGKTTSDVTITEPKQKTVAKIILPESFKLFTEYFHIQCII